MFGRRKMSTGYDPDIESISTQSLACDLCLPALEWIFFTTNDMERHSSLRRME